tara:strand:+ start:3319 stop:3804 length:486 start_codon:yes stop_codon:yes gene_type:complete
MAAGPKRVNNNPQGFQTPGWTKDSHFGYDPEREADHRKVASQIYAMGMSGVTSGAAYAGISSGLQSRERMRGYGIGGKPLDNFMKIQGASAAPAPVSQPAAEPATAPVIPQIVMPEIPPPPPPPKGFTTGSGSVKRQSRARKATQPTKVEGKKGLMLKVNY